jgi:quinol monooxygenase YgiN
MQVYADNEEFIEMPVDESDATKDAMVTFVNRFTLHASPEEFEHSFTQISEFMSRQAGFLRYTLLRQVGDQNSYVNIALWRDAESFRRAVTHPGFRPHASAIRTLSRSESSLYTLRQTFSVDTAVDHPVLKTDDSNRAL